MQKLTNDQKAKIYNGMLRKYQKLQEEVRLIQAQNIDVSAKDQRRIQEMEAEMKKIYASTRRLYN
jgi:predicted GTPase